MINGNISLIEKRVRRLEVNFIRVLFFFPILLMLINWETRTSISDFVYSEQNWVFYLFFFTGALLFAFNGLVFKEHSYNLILSILLLLIAIFKHKEQVYIHFISAGLFYIGSVAAMIIFSSAKQRKIKILFSLVTFLGLMGHFVFNFYNLFVAEWIGLLPICLHFQLESQNKMD